MRRVGEAALKVRRLKEDLQEVQRRRERRRQDGQCSLADATTGLENGRTAARWWQRKGEGWSTRGAWDLHPLAAGGLSAKTAPLAAGPRYPIPGVVPSPAPLALAMRRRACACHPESAWKHHHPRP